MIKMNIKENGNGYSATTFIREKQLNFVGENTFLDEAGNFYYSFFKIVCPKCKADGNKLEHHNWFESKERGTDLLIKCKNCGNIFSEQERQIISFADIIW